MNGYHSVGLMDSGLTQALSSEDTVVCLNGVDQALPFQIQSLLQSVNLGNLSFVVGFDATWPHIVSASDKDG